MTEAVETVKVVAETAAPVMVSDGTINWKKVAIVAGGVLAVAGCAYACKKLLDKRKKVKSESVTIIMDQNGTIIDTSGPVEEVAPAQ